MNLPAHLVVIVNTMQYSQGEWHEYSNIEILQMAGRAGRPQFDTSGTCVIMTRHEMEQHYRQILGGTCCVESHMHKQMQSHLNAEIASQGAQMPDQAACIAWLKCTYLGSRIKVVTSN